MKRIISLVFVGIFFILSFSGFGHAGMIFESEIPVVENDAITINGDSTDWYVDGVEIAPFLTDAQGDSTCEEGTDIKSLYLAKDDHYLYWRMDNWDGFYLGTPESERYPVIVFYEIDPLREDGFPAGGVTEQIYKQIYSNGGRIVGSIAGIIHDDGEPWDWTGLHNDTEWGQINDIAEGKIPLEYFDNPLPDEHPGINLSLNHLFLYYWRPEHSGQCDSIEKSYINNTPSASAGPDVSVSLDQTPFPTLAGTAGDPDPDDNLQYRWMSGETVWLDWTDAVESQCPLDLNAQSLAVGTYELTLEVTDGEVTAQDQMILTVSPQFSRYFVQYFSIFTHVVDNDNPTTYFAFSVGDNEELSRTKLRNVVQSASVELFNSSIPPEGITVIDSVPTFDPSIITRIEVYDYNKNGKVDAGEVSTQVDGEFEYWFITTPITPHEGGTYELTTTFENGNIATHRVVVPGGLTADELPPVANAAAYIDQLTGSLHFSWDLPATKYPSGASIQIRISAYLADGTDRYLSVRIQDILSTLSSFEYNNRLVDLFNSLGIGYIKFNARVYSSDGVSVSKTANMEYAIDGYKLTPASIPEPCSSMYTDEEVDQIVRDECPGNSEFQGRPQTPGNSNPPGQKKK